jgi:hypothetical protein
LGAPPDIQSSDARKRARKLEPKVSWKDGGEVMEKSKFEAVEDFVFMPVREYTGVDLDGQIAVPRSEIQERLKELYKTYADSGDGGVLDSGLRAR